MTLSGLERARFRTIPFGLTFTLLRILPHTVLVWDDQERRKRTLPRAILERALRERKLVYLGLATRRTA